MVNDLIQKEKKYTNKQFKTDSYLIQWKFMLRMVKR